MRTLILRRPSLICAKLRDCSHIYHWNAPRFTEIQTWLSLLTRQLWQPVLLASFNGHTRVRSFFLLPTQAVSFERHPSWGNYRNCDRGKILSLYEDPQGMVLFANRDLCISLFDFLGSVDLSPLQLCCYCLLSAFALVVRGFSFIAVASQFWFQLGRLLGLWTCGQWIGCNWLWSCAFCNFTFHIPASLCKGCDSIEQVSPTLYSRSTLFMDSSHTQTAFQAYHSLL